MPLQPLIPDPLGSLTGGTLPNPFASASAPPTLGSMPDAPPPTLPTGLRPLVTNPRQQQEQDLQAKIASFENPSKPQGFWGKLRHGLAVAGNVAGDIVAPNLMADIPGTQLNGQVQHAQNQKELAGLENQDQTEQNNASERAARGAQTAATEQKTAEEPALNQADIDLKNAQISGLLHPQAKTDFEAWQKQNPGKPVEEWLKAQAANKAPAAGDDFEKFYKDYITDNNIPDSAHNRMLARKDWAAASQAPQRAPQITIVNPQGQVQSVHAGDTIAPGSTTVGGFNTQTLNADKAKTALEASKASLDYAQNYVQSGKYTGPGDEALLEKFFDLAKPSSGFRMSQQQIDLLQHSRSWMESAEGQAQHAATGTWFSPTQRQNIADTMNNLYQAKSGESGGKSSSAGQNFTVNGKTYNIPADKVAEFKKDHPDAR